MATSGKDFRLESDLIGERQISNEHLYGVQTLRGIENFNISNFHLCDYPSSSTGSHGPRKLPLSLTTALAFSPTSRRTLSSRLATSSSKASTTSTSPSI